MKGLSLWQFWASAMAKGMKKNETRSWKTDYRGDLVICSALRRPTREECGDEETYRKALALPYGFALCVVEVYDMISTDYFPVEVELAIIGSNLYHISEMERSLGNYSPGRWAWMTRNCRPLDPVPVKGAQGLFDIPAPACFEIQRQLNEKISPIS